MASLSAKQRGIFSSFLMPLCEETVLGPGPVIKVNADLQLSPNMPNDAQTMQK